MLIVPPIAITDAVLTSTNVVETTPAAYSAGTTYAVGNTASVQGSNQAQAVYTSLVAGNVAHTPSTSPTFWSLTGNTYSAWAAPTAYFLNDIVIVVGANSHLQYQCSLAVTGGTGPATDTTHWVQMGPTNAWAMFDNAVSSQTSNPLTITQRMTVPGRFDTIACMNCMATSVSIVITDPTTLTAIYSQTFTMVSDSGITDDWSYCFLPIDLVPDLIVTGLPPYANAIVDIVITGIGGGAAMCGAIVFGLSRNVGATQYGASVGILDYSTKTQDTFGNYQIVKRTFSKRGDFTVWVPNTLVDKLEFILAGYRATPVLFIACDASGYTSTSILGYYKDFAVALTYASVSILTISIEGLN